MVHREPCLSVGLAVEMDVKEAYPLAVESRIDRQVEPVRSAPHAFEDFFADGGGSASSAQRLREAAPGPCAARNRYKEVDR
jgi:hypothetical protein